MINMRFVCANQEFYFDQEFHLVSIMLGDTFALILFLSRKVGNTFALTYFHYATKLCWALSRGKSINQNAARSTAAATMRQPPLPLLPSLLPLQLWPLWSPYQHNQPLYQQPAISFLATEYAHTHTHTHTNKHTHGHLMPSTVANRLTDTPAACNRIIVQQIATIYSVYAMQNINKII